MCSERSHTALFSPKPVSSPPVETPPVSLHIHSEQSLDRHDAPLRTPPALLPICRAVIHAFGPCVAPGRRCVLHRPPVPRGTNRAVPAQPPIAPPRRPRHQRPARRLVPDPRVQSNSIERLDRTTRSHHRQVGVVLDGRTRE